MGVNLRVDDYSAMQGPSPDGFHVPSKDEWVTLCGILTTTFSIAKNATTMGAYLKMPVAGYRSPNDASVYSVGTHGYYWSSTSYDANGAYDLYFNSSDISAQVTAGRGRAFSVRCFKDMPAIPTSSWTTLYDGSSVATGAGVFYNATDGLISVSGDGQTWYTIMDKNLGATTVYNQGDTETDANCGYFYQRGNNYGFPHSGTITTTSSTTVDVTGYGPGNYYSSSIFITVSPRNSTTNDNLWGGVTGVVLVQKELKNAYIGIPNPTSIVLDKSSISLTTIGQTEQLTATIEPTISDHSITWSSDDTTVATVSTTGLVTCVTPGECTITATTVNGLAATCGVTNQSWQPGINTVLYMPLDGDVVDYSTYNRSFTVYGNSASVGTPVFDTLASGKKVANFIATSGNNSNWFAFTDNVTDIPSSGNMTVSLWMNRSSNGNRYMGIVDYRDNYRYTWMTGIHENNRFLFHGSSQETSSFIPTVGTWYNMICTVDNGRCYIYKDGVQIYSDSYTYNSPSQKVCLGCYYNSSATNYREEAFNGKLGDVIVENKARTAQEVADYYDQTKSLYGIS